MYCVAYPCRHISARDITQILLNFEAGFSAFSVDGNPADRNPSRFAAEIPLAEPITGTDVLLTEQFM